jgi:hypothetical protein
VQIFGMAQLKPRVVISMLQSSVMASSRWKVAMAVKDIRATAGLTLVLMAFYVHAQA